MSDNPKRFPHAMTLKELIIYIVGVILIGLFFFFVRGDTAGRIVACIACPLMIGYLILAYLKERKADKNAEIKNDQMIDGSYFESSEWHESYVRYINEHPFERPKYSNMKKDLLKRFQRREYMLGMIFFFFLLIGTACVFYLGRTLIGVCGLLIFGLLFYLEFSSYIGMPVRRWLRGDIDHNALEESYKNSLLLTYKKNGLGFGTTHIHGFTEKKVYAVDYDLVDGISRKIVRLKTYEDGIYSKEEYQHFAVIHTRLPNSDNTEDIEIELNEYQVQMAIDRLSTYKPGEKLKQSAIEIKEHL